MSHNLSIHEMLSLTKEAAIKFHDKAGKALRSDEFSYWSLIPAIDFLMANNLTIDWQGSSSDPFGYETIWEYCAGEHFGKGRKAREKAYLADDRCNIMRNGYNRLKERLYEEWSVPLFTVPREVNRKGIEVITCDCNYVVNDRGQTAMDIYFERDSKNVGGQLRAAYQRGAMVYGEDRAKTQLAERLSAAISIPLPVHRANPMYDQALLGFSG